MAEKAKTYTEADVVRWRDSAIIAAASHKHTRLCCIGLMKKERCVCGVQDGIDSVEHLAAAALEGAKVPGLVAALDAATRCCGGNDETPREHTQDCERHRFRAECAESQLSTLQARVAELDGLLKHVRETENAELANLKAQAANLATERDAERASVEAMAKAIDKHLPGFHPAQSPDEGIHRLAEERDGWRLTAENRKRWWEEAVSQRDAARAQVGLKREEVPSLPSDIHLTKREGDVLAFVAKHLSEKKYPPGVRDVADCMGWKSTHFAGQCLDALSRKGCVTWTPKKARTLALTKVGQSVLTQLQPQEASRG